MEWANPNVRLPFSNWGWVSSDRVRRPSDLSTAVCLEVYASFEFQPTLGAGKQLRKLTITVEQLLDHSAKGIHEWEEVSHRGLVAHTTAAFTLFPKDGDGVSPCSSTLATVERQKCENSDSSASKALGPHSVSRRLVSTRSSLISVCP